MECAVDSICVAFRDMLTRGRKNGPVSYGAHVNAASRYFTSSRHDCSDFVICERCVASRAWHFATFPFTVLRYYSHAYLD